MKKSAINWELLQGLRARFLGESGGTGANYWDSEELLDQYDQTFAERIAWKWRAVWEEAIALGFPPEKPVSIVDWGCGTGTASREAIKALGAENVREVWLSDHSRLAASFAGDRLDFTGTIHINSKLDALPPNTLLLVSHVANELDAKTLDSLVALAARADHIMWVEPGTPSASRTLIAVREKLRGELTFVAPCPHQTACGLLALDRSRDWCHHFAPPPLEAFQSRFWHEFGEKMKIDLRSLPTSYLVATRTKVPNSRPNRVLGRPRLYKGYAMALVCEESGVSEWKIMERTQKALVKSFKEKRFSITLPPNKAAT